MKASEILNELWEKHDITYETDDRIEKGLKDYIARTSGGVVRELDTSGNDQNPSDRGN